MRKALIWQVGKMESVADVFHRSRVGLVCADDSHPLV
jgi:hypothetical protein